MGAAYTCTVIGRKLWRSTLLLDDKQKGKDSDVLSKV